jgi:uncharacterized protein YukE
MSNMGADVDQLASLGRTLKNQISSIDGVVSTVTSALGSTVWTGPARQQFENDWNNVFRSTLNRLDEAFDKAGSECINRSTALQQAMS